MENYEYFQNKRPDRIYLSRLIEQKSFSRDESNQPKETIRPLRIVSKVIDCQEGHQFIKDGKEISLRITPGGRQEIKAKFYEDTRGITTLTIQKYTTETGAPHQSYFTFVGTEIEMLYNFIRNIPIIPISSNESTKIDAQFLKEIVLTKEQTIALFKEKPELIKEILESGITETEIINLAHRKKQLEMYDRLLHEAGYFEEMKSKIGSYARDEDVWQRFFERNTWIFGYGLDYVFNSQLEGKKLEQVVSGSSFCSSGKRVDALLKSQGIINSLCFGEIKTHHTHLLKRSKQSYRPETWIVSDELSGGIAQIQRTVQKSIEGIKTKLQMKDLHGELTGEELYLYHPRSFLIIGSLGEFEGQNGINEDRYSSFELFRRNIFNPEIITFDELHERAKHIVKSSD